MGSRISRPSPSPPGPAPAGGQRCQARGLGARPGAGQLDVVAGFLEGTSALEGLDVDQDLRWDLLIGLVAAGRSGEEQIRTEEARDRTTTGRERAAEARASIPTPEAKQATWRTLVDDASMPNETQVRVLRGLTNVERHPELLAPFVGAYVEAIDSVWSSRTFHMAENLLTGLWSCVTGGLLALALGGLRPGHAQRVIEVLAHDPSQCGRGLGVGLQPARQGGASTPCGPLAPSTWPRTC